MVNMTLLTCCWSCPLLLWGCLSTLLSPIECCQYVWSALGDRDLGPSRGVIVLTQPDVLASFPTPR